MKQLLPFAASLKNIKADNYQIITDTCVNTIVDTLNKA